MNRDWSPFRICGPDERPLYSRDLHTLEGVGDRLRTAAFAEIQAREAFLWAAEVFPDASDDLKRSWKNLAHAEQKHLTWLLTRMNELGLDVAERPMGLGLWHSLMKCTTAREFAIYIANAEERGRKAGVKFEQSLREADPVSAEIFGKIAEEEIAHIELALKYFPDAQLQMLG